MRPRFIHEARDRNPANSHLPGVNGTGPSRSIFEFRARRHQMNGLRELKVTTTAIIETVWAIEDLALTLTFKPPAVACDCPLLILLRWKPGPRPC
jgi:hypothetical protein